MQGDVLRLRDVMAVVESGVRWWRSTLASTDAATRAEAARAIEELSRILHSLSQQLALGRETVRITSNPPAIRRYGVGCSVCGRGNRAGANYCYSCGSPLPGARPVGESKQAMQLRYTVASRSDTGRVRKNNQDSVFAGQVGIAPGSTALLCLVADGMGGARAGEQASRIASDVTQAYVHDHAAGKTLDDAAWQLLLRSAANLANDRVYTESRANAEQQGMGTTLTVALFVGDRVHLASVGDSRAYLINHAGVTEQGTTSAQLTSDHSLVARLVDIGQITAEQARTHPQRNILYRSIGTDPAVEVDTRSEQVKPGDILLLCSDGLVNTMRDDEMAALALSYPDPEQACDRLVALANERGGTDNISVVIVRVEG